MSSTVTVVRSEGSPSSTRTPGAGSRQLPHPPAPGKFSDVVPAVPPPAPDSFPRRRWNGHSVFWVGELEEDKGYWARRARYEKMVYKLERPGSLQIESVSMPASPPPPTPSERTALSAMTAHRTPAGRRRFWA